MSEGKGEHTATAVYPARCLIFYQLNKLLCAKRYNMINLCIKYYTFLLNYSYFSPVEFISRLLKTFKGHFSKKQNTFTSFRFRKQFCIYNIHEVLSCFLFFYIVQLLGLNWYTQRAENGCWLIHQFYCLLERVKWVE